MITIELQPLAHSPDYSSGRNSRSGNLIKLTAVLLNPPICIAQVFADEVRLERWEGDLVAQAGGLSVTQDFNTGNRTARVNADHYVNIAAVTIGSDNLERHPTQRAVLLAAKKSPLDIPAALVLACDQLHRVLVR